MDTGLGLRAAFVQAVLVAGLFALLLALPLPHDFFREWGWLTGPSAWVACSLGTSRLVELPLRTTVTAALVGGVAGAVVGVLVNHFAGLVVAIAAFAAVVGWVAGREPTRERVARL